MASWHQATSPSACKGAGEARAFVVTRHRYGVSVVLYGCLIACSMLPREHATCHIKLIRDIH